MVRVKALSSGNVSGGGCSGCLAAADRWRWEFRADSGSDAGRLLFSGDAPEAEAVVEFESLIADLKAGPTGERFKAQLFDQANALKRVVTFASGGAGAAGAGAKPGMSTGVKVAIGLGVAGALYLAWRRFG